MKATLIMLLMPIMLVLFIQNGQSTGMMIFQPPARNIKDTGRLNSLPNRMESNRTIRIRTDTANVKKGRKGPVKKSVNKKGRNAHAGIERQ